MATINMQKKCPPRRRDEANLFVALLRSKAEEPRGSPAAPSLVFGAQVGGIRRHESLQLRQGEDQFFPLSLVKSDGKSSQSIHAKRMLFRHFKTDCGLRCGGGFEGGVFCDQESELSFGHGE